MYRLSTFVIILSCLLMVGCESRNKVNDTELALGARAQNNIQAVADTLDKIPGMVPYSDILDDQLRVLSTAYLITGEDIAELSQNFTLESNLDMAELAANPQAAAAKSKEQANKDIKDIEESQSGGFWAWAAAAGGVAIWVARVLNVPGIQLLTDPVIKGAFGFVTKPLEASASRAEKKAQSLALTVESSIVGRAAMAALDRELGENEALKSVVDKFTGGKANSIEGLFTFVAKSNAVDSSAGKHADVVDALNEVVDTMPTEGNVPIALSKILNTVGGA